MDRLARKVFPCKFSLKGCAALLSYIDKPEHEQACEFRPYVCPFPGGSCKWQGSLDQVTSHLVHWHESPICEGEHIVLQATDINVPDALNWVMVQSCFGHHFMVVLKKQEKYDGYQQFFAMVQLMGSQAQADKFIYRLELNGHKRRLTWEAPPRIIRTGVQAVIVNSDCLVFDSSMAQLFAYSGNLVIEVTISLSVQNHTE
ncbi:E3 ubiquitin-protein ligase Siah1-like [Amblyomma americanum]